MHKDVTVVFYPKEGYNPEAFHVINANKNNLQGIFDKNEILAIKCIFIELYGIGSHHTECLFKENDIHRFLKEWNIKY